MNAIFNLEVLEKKYLSEHIASASYEFATTLSNT